MIQGLSRSGLGYRTGCRVKSSQITIFLFVILHCNRLKQKSSGFRTTFLYERINSTLRKKYPYSQLFWSVFFLIRTEYSVRMWENTDRNKSEYGRFLCSANQPIPGQYFALLQCLSFGTVLESFGNKAKGESQNVGNKKTK